jgi:Telomere resolvase
MAMGKRTWLESDLRDRVIPLLSGLEDNANGHRQAKNLCKNLRSGWANRGLKTLKQQQSLMDTTRATIKEQLGSDHFSLDWVKFSTQEYTELNNQKQDSVASRNESVQFIDNPDVIVSKAVELLDSPEWAEVSAGLSVLTGRRSSELLSTASFEKASKWSVLFTGALKRRGETQALSFEIPTLTTADRVVKALAKVRAELPQAMNLPATQVNAKFGGAVARACDQHFEGLVPRREGKDNLYTHLFRAVYATISTFWYCPPAVNDTEFKATIQGHYAVLDAGDSTLRRSLAASRHYSDYEIADSVIAQYGGKRKGIKLGHGGVKPLAVFAQSKPEPIETAAPITPKHRSSLRVWREDHDQLVEVLEQFEGKTQPDKVTQWIRWSLEQLQKAPTVIEPVEMIKPEPALQEEQLQEEELQEEIEAIQSEAIQSNEAIGSKTLTAPALETKIDTLVNAIAQLVEIQTKALTTPTTTLSPAPATRRQVTTLTPASAQIEGQAQSERKYRPRGQNQELVDQAIKAIMDHNDQAQRHDDKWAITINALKAWIGSQHAITQGLKARAVEIQAHHQKHQIDPAKHNLRHRGKTPIHEVIQVG